MTLLEWRDEFRIGIDEVDYEHRRLIELINAAFDVLEPGTPRGRLELALGEILTVVSAHFALEEKVMRTRGYPALAEHKADHERLLDDLLDVMDRATAREAFDKAAFAKRLADWFAVHFRTHDARLHHYLTD